MQSSAGESHLEYSKFGDDGIEYMLRNILLLDILLQHLVHTTTYVLYIVLWQVWRYFIMLSNFAPVVELSFTRPERFFLTSLSRPSRVSRYFFHADNSIRFTLLSQLSFAGTSLARGSRDCCTRALRTCSGPLGSITLA